MFDRQLTMDGREEDCAPVHEQPRMFEFPKTTRGQLALETGAEYGIAARRADGALLLRTYSTLYSERQGLGPRAFDVHHYDWIPRP